MPCIRSGLSQLKVHNKVLLGFAPACHLLQISQAGAEVDMERLAIQHLIGFSLFTVWA